jgi:hypothetical protein
LKDQAAVNPFSNCKQSVQPPIIAEKRALEELPVFAGVTEMVNVKENRRLLTVAPTVEL